MVEAPVLGGLPLDLLVLTSKPKGLSPSQRFRLEQWVPHLERDHGIRLHFEPFESDELSQILNRPGRTGRKAMLVLRDFVRRVVTIMKVRRFDAVVIHREAALIGPAILERVIAGMGVPVIYDFDDSIWSSAQEAGNGLFSKLHFFGKTATICRLASAVTVGNSFLADYARRQNNNVAIIPTTIEMAAYPAMPEPSANTPFVVCWTGSISTLVHFDHARPALEALAAKVDLVVKVICNSPPTTNIDGAETRYVPWNAASEAQDVGDCHAGIMPLPDNEATRGKCGLKALQYMATGRPVVVSPVGMNRDLIEGGVNGFLAASDEEFCSALLELARSPDLRKRIGDAGRQTIETRFSATTASRQFADVVRSVVCA